MSPIIIHAKCVTITRSTHGEVVVLTNASDTAGINDPSFYGDFEIAIPKNSFRKIEPGDIFAITMRKVEP